MDTTERPTEATDAPIERCAFCGQSAGCVPFTCLVCLHTTERPEVLSPLTAEAVARLLSQGYRPPLVLA